MHRNLLTVLLLLGFALPAAAVELTGSDVIIPIVGRTAGMHGTFWKSDVYVTNLTRTRSSSLPVRFEFMSGGTVQSFEVWLGAREGYVVHDFVLTKLQQESGVGMLRIRTEVPGGRIAARAWVYNRDAEGREVGQNVQGIAAASLMRDSLLTGLVVNESARTNVGIANPHDVDAEVWLVDRDPSFQHLAKVVVPARGVVQLSLGHLFYLSDEESVTVEVRSKLPVMPYASVIRNSSGDPQFIAPAKLYPLFDAPPACLDALVVWEGNEQDTRFTAHVRDAADAPATIAGLAAKYGFTVLDTLQNAFYAELTPAQLSAMRCDPAIECIGCGWPWTGPVP
ncbi:MAG TPA: hypothetical protein VGF28_25305 [Thermoanaerobaculia bacterium]|jgi:hypothetical protein